MKYLIFPTFLLICILIVVLFPNNDRPIAFLVCEIIVAPLFGLGYLLAFIIKWFRQGIKDAVPFLLITLSFFTIPWKTTFVYYNFIPYLILIGVNSAVLYKQIRFKAPGNSKFVLGPVTLLLAMLFVIGNENYLMLRYSHITNSWKPYGLQLSDFTPVETMPEGRSAKAIINTNYIRIFNKTCNYPSIVIVPLQYPNQSYFILGDDSYNRRILDHEQLHFDIKELYARKIRNFINNRWYSGIRAKEILFDSLVNEQRMFQNLYDSSYIHAENRRKNQAVWNKLIRGQLGI